MEFTWEWGSKQWQHIVGQLLIKATKKSKAEQRDREQWQFCNLKVAMWGWPPQKTTQDRGGSGPAGIWEHRALGRGKGRCKFRCRDAYLAVCLLFPLPSPKQWPMAHSPWITEGPYVDGTVEAWNKGLGFGLGRGEWSETATHFISADSSQLLWNSWHVFLVLNLL